MTAPTTATTLTPELKGLLKRVKLGKTLDTLPERLTLARTSKLTHAEFLELVLADEVARRDHQSAGLRARTAKLDAAMTLEAWDPDANVTYDQHVWAELTDHCMDFWASFYAQLRHRRVGDSPCVARCGSVTWRLRPRIAVSTRNHLHK